MVTYTQSEAETEQPTAPAVMEASTPFDFAASRAAKKHMLSGAGAGARTTACDGTPMVTIDQLPVWMKEHASPYITQEYRLCSSYTATFLSLFYWHNCWLDTVTALFNMVHATALYVWLRYYSDMTLTGEDHFVFAMFYLTCLVHSPPSMSYHLIGCAGKSLWDFLFFQRFDFLFIFVSSIPLSIALCYYPLYNQPELMCVSVFGVIGCAAYCLSVIATPFDSSRRVKMIAALVFFYTLPVWYVVLTHPAQGFWTSPGLWWGVGIVVSLGIGAYVYATKWPECKWNDAVWSSHSLMHLCVNAAYFCEFGFIVAAYHWHHSPGTERAFDSWFF